MASYGAEELTIESADAHSQSAAQVLAPGSITEHAEAHGYFDVVIYDENGVEVFREEHIPNVVTTVGKNLALDTYLAGSAYTVTGPFMGLISSTSFTGVAVGDTMASHAGWLEAGNANTPTYTAPRKTCAWNAAASGAKALSAALVFAITGNGTVKGCFIVYGTGALSTVDNTAGTLYSAGLFTSGDAPVANGYTLSCNYTASL